jgi:dephospho-CoA kinase
VGEDFAVKSCVRVALTGGIATGKSYVRARLEALGVPAIDADRLARGAIAPGTPGLAAVVARFGDRVLDAGRQVDRAALGAIVFADERARQDLEAIVHPVVRRAIDDWYASLGPDTPFAVAEIPLLYETGRDREFAAVLVVACEPARQIERLMARGGLDATAARQRLAAQLPIEEKVRRASYVVNTDGSFADTDAQVRAVRDQLLARFS